MNINLLGVNFGARSTRNWDGVRSDNRSQVVKSYDDAIAKIQEKRDEAVELDKFISSKEIQPLISKLPRKDIVNIKYPAYVDEFYSSEETQTLEYIPRNSKSLQKCFYS